jgi:hypothetical protein
MNIHPAHFVYTQYIVYCLLVPEADLALFSRRPAVLVDSQSAFLP